MPRIWNLKAVFGLSSTLSFPMVSFPHSRSPVDRWWREPLRAAPLRPEIHQHRPVRLQHRGFQSRHP